MDHPDITYKISSDDLHTVISDIMSAVITKSILAPYEFRVVGTFAACEILGVSESTIRRYIKDRKLIPLDTKGIHHHFSLRYLLEFPIAEIKSHKSR